MKIFDCFLWFNEEELLEIRLNELKGAVDFHVLVEMNQTHSGKDHDFQFDALKADPRFAPFAEKIIHIKHTPTKRLLHWDSEYSQRNAIVEGLADAARDDIIIVSDVDELIRASKINEIRSIKYPARLSMPMYYYYFNNRLDMGWNYAAACPRNYLTTPQELRTGFRGHVEFTYGDISDAGWHFSYLGDPDKISMKIKSFSHGEYDQERFTKPEAIRRRIANGEDIFDRGIGMKRADLDNTFPSFLVENRERFKQFIL